MRLNLDARLSNAAPFFRAYCAISVVCPVALMLAASLGVLLFERLGLPPERFPIARFTGTLLATHGAILIAHAFSISANSLQNV